MRPLLRACMAICYDPTVVAHHLRAGYCRAGKLQQAWSLFTSVEAVQQEPHSYATYQGLITCAVKVTIRKVSQWGCPGCWEHSLNCASVSAICRSPFAFMAASSNSLAEAKPAAGAHQNAVSQAGEVYSALRALRAIQAAGMQPNVVTYCGLISALSRERRQREQQLGYRLWCELHDSPLRLDAAAYRTGEQAPSVTATTPQLGKACTTVICRQDQTTLLEAAPPARALPSRCPALPLQH